MPWFPEIELAKADRARGAAPQRLGFLEGIEAREPGELISSFAGAPMLDDPRHGRVEGEAAFSDYVLAMRRWLKGERGWESLAITTTPRRGVEEVSVKLGGEHPELPIAIASDLAADGRIETIRVYHSLWPLTREHRVRSPLLTPDPTIELSGAPGDYQRGLAAGNAEEVVACFEPDGVVREPSGGPYTYRGEAHRRIYDAMFANEGGIPLEFCTATDDGTRCALEYNCVRWGKDELPPQAGLAVYERGQSGRLAAARIYDDVTPPAPSDSTSTA